MVASDRPKDAAGPFETVERLGVHHQVIAPATTARRGDTVDRPVDLEDQATDLRNRPAVGDLVDRALFLREGEALALTQLLVDQLEDASLGRIDRRDALTADPLDQHVRGPVLAVAIAIVGDEVGLRAVLEVDERMGHLPLQFECSGSAYSSLITISKSGFGSASTSKSSPTS